MATHSPAVLSSMANNNLDLALRIRADLKQGQDELGRFTAALDDATHSADTAGSSLASMGETANQQVSRIKEMVNASLAQAQANQQMRDSLTELTLSEARASEGTMERSRAQTAAMQAYWDAELAIERKAAADKRAAEEAAKTTAESGKQEAALRRLMGQIDGTEKALSELDRQERELAEHFQAGRLDAEGYARALDQIRNRRNSLEGVGDSAKKANLEVSNLTSSIRRVYGLIATGVAGYGAVSFSRAVVNTALEWQRAQTTMEAATGSAGAARRELEFVRETSERLGLELLSTAQSYARLVAAAKETPTLQPFLQEIFEGVGSASAVLNLAEQDVNSIMLAFEQMVSKGKVQSQELVMQLGQRLPGAFALAARSLNTTTEQLSDWLAKGQIAADEFLPRFARALQDAYGSRAQTAAAGLQGEINRLNNEWTTFKIEAGEAGFIDSIVGAMGELRDVLKDPAIREGLNALISGMGTAASFSARAAGGISGFAKWIGEEFAMSQVGPLPDDPVRLEAAIADRYKKIESAQAKYDRAWRTGNQKRGQEIQDEVTRWRAEVSKWQSELDAFNNPLPGINQPMKPEASAPDLPIFTPGAGKNDSAAADRLRKQQEDWVAQLEKEAETYGKGKAALREYELGQRNLTGSLSERAKAAWAVLDAAEKQKKADEQAKRDTKLLEQLQLDYLKATGQAVDAAGAEIEKKYGALQERLLARGDEDGANLVDRLIGIEKAAAAFADLEQQLDRLYAEQARREQSIQTQIQAGLISEREARRQIIELHQETATEVENLLPQMQELAEATGDPAALDRLKDMSVQLETLRTQANELTLALRDGLQEGLAEGIMGLARGTMDLRDAIDSLLLGVAESMARMASEGLAEMATQGIMDLFRQGSQAAIQAAGQKAAAEVAAINTVTAAQTVADTTRATSSVVAANTSAAGQATAAATTASAWTPAAIAASIGSFGSAAAIGLAAVVAAMAFQAFAEGGHVRGPGTGTSDSINAKLSNNEFVTRAAVVTQPGALPFLDDFNKRGMAALDDWAGAARHSTGGLAGVPAPAAPAPTMWSGRMAEPSSAAPAQVANNFRFNTVFDIEEVAARLGSSPAFQDVLVRATADNATAMKSALDS